MKTSIRSIQKQTFREVEIIMIDGQSSDDSYKLILEEAAQNKRIAPFKNEEQTGLLYTKAKGIKEPKGNFILFLQPEDSFLCNDVVLNDLYKQLMNLMQIFFISKV